MMRRILVGGRRYYQDYISDIQKTYCNLVKTLRIDNEDIHKELLKIQGEMQARMGEIVPMEEVLAELIRIYKKHK